MNQGYYLIKYEKYNELLAIDEGNIGIYSFIAGSYTEREKLNPQYVIFSGCSERCRF